MRLFLVGFLLLLMPGIATAAQRCGDVMVAMREALADVNQSNYAFSLKRERQTYWILFLSRPEQPKSERLPWRLLQRQGESTDYCLVAGGESMTLLGNMEAAETSKRYGMPGSGYPRCSHESLGPLPGSTGVRMWANAELGESAVIVLAASSGPKDYVLLITDDGYWILLDVDRNDIDRGCYVARGDGSTLHENFSMPREDSPHLERDKQE